MRKFVYSLIGASLLALATAACTTADELRHKASAYNEAISDSTNEILLLNALRASQRAPMSFTGLGDVSATPNFSADASGTLNFTPYSLATYNLNPNVKYGGGFSTFAMKNLNQGEFMEALRRPVDSKLVDFFISQNWPEELLASVVIGKYNVNQRVHDELDRRASLRCAAATSTRDREICDIIAAQREQARNANCQIDLVGDGILNTARDVCGMAKFQLLVRRLRLLNIPYLKKGALRSPIAIIYYLGELIAAQNYSTRQYTPQILVATPDGHRRLVDLFVVRPGDPAGGRAAVKATYNGMPFHIPFPRFGAEDEARSLQVLDLVSQVIAAQTSSKNLPQVNNLGVLTLQ